MARARNLIRLAAFAVAVALPSLVAAVAAQAAEHPAGRPAKRAAANDSLWKEAARAKANGSGVRLRYAVPAQLQPGQPALVRLEFSNVTADDAAVEWRAPASVAMTVRGGGPTSAMTLPRGAVTTIEFDVTPSSDGMAYLDVFTSQHGRGSAQSVPLKVGSGQVSLKREGTVQATPAGERIHSLPSQPK